MILNGPSCVTEQGSNSGNVWLKVPNSHQATQPRCQVGSIVPPTGSSGYWPNGGAELCCPLTLEALRDLGLKTWPAVTVCFLLAGDKVCTLPDLAASSLLSTLRSRTHRRSWRCRHTASRFWPSCTTSVFVC